MADVNPSVYAPRLAVSLDAIPIGLADVQQVTVKVGLLDIVTVP